MEGGKPARGWGGMIHSRPKTLLLKKRLSPPPLSAQKWATRPWKGLRVRGVGVDGFSEASLFHALLEFRKIKCSQNGAGTFL